MKKGFTLIELLVVVAIIGLLSTIVTVSLGSARVKARDAKRLSDVRTIQSALEIFVDSCGKYPVAASATTFVATLGATDCTTGAAGQTLANTNIMSVAPVNPLPGGANYVYAISDGTTYSLSFSLEGSTAGLASGAHTATPAGTQ